jgi:integrase
MEANAGGLPMSVMRSDLVSRARGTWLKEGNRMIKASVTDPKNPIIIMGLSDGNILTTERRNTATPGRRIRTRRIRSIEHYSNVCSDLARGCSRGLLCARRRDHASVIEAAMIEIITLEPNTLNQLLIRLMYVSGGRVSEVVGANWIDLQSRLLEITLMAV